jgi:hypothetical protein
MRTGAAKEARRRGEQGAEQGQQQERCGVDGERERDSEAATRRRSAPAGGGGGAAYHGEEAGCGESAAAGKRGRQRRALRIIIGGVATRDWPSEWSRGEVLAATERTKFEDGLSDSTDENRMELELLTTNELKSVLLIFKQKKRQLLEIRNDLVSISTKAS